MNRGKGKEIADNYSKRFKERETENAPGHMSGKTETGTGTGETKTGPETTGAAPTGPARRPRPENGPQAVVTTITAAPAPFWN